MFHLRRTDPVAAHLERLGLSADQAARIGQGGTPLDLAPGTVLCTRGERGTQAFLILEGTANVLTDEGVITVGPGDVVGELATLDPKRTRNATVVAESALEVLVYDVATFRSLARDEDLVPVLAPARG
jgi:CRP-like cAMP-binding protein